MPPLIDAILTSINNIGLATENLWCLVGEDLGESASDCKEVYMTHRNTRARTASRSSATSARAPSAKAVAAAEPTDQRAMDSQRAMDKRLLHWNNNSPVSVQRAMAGTPWRPRSPRLIPWGDPPEALYQARNIATQAPSPTLERMRLGLWDESPALLQALRVPPPRPDISFWLKVRA